MSGRTHRYRCTPFSRSTGRGRDTPGRRHRPRYTARMTLDVAPALRARIKLAAFDRDRDDGRDAARGAGAAVSKGHVMTLGDQGVRWSLALLAGSLIALGWATVATSPPRLVYNASDSVPVGW